MSKKRKIKLEIDKFYYAYGGKAHPACIFEKTDIGTYKSIKTGTTDGKSMIEIKPTQIGTEHSYINNRPFEGTRRDYGDKELLGIAFDESDFDTINKVKTRKPKLTKNARLAYEKHKKIPSSD